jgi:hypothetical protein
MKTLNNFIEEWFPKTEEWNNVAKYILESGVELVEEQNQKWLPGYTNISKSSKPHHKDEYVRYMEESMFQLHDLLHNIFTINVFCDEEEYVKRQIFGELFVFYLTEYVIPSAWYDKHAQYIDDIRDCYWLMQDVMQVRPDNINRIDWMWKIFIEDMDVYTLNPKPLEKYRKMFKEDLENSRKNYKFVKDLNLKDYCMVGASSQNHIDFFEAVKKGAIKNIKREFNVKLPKDWI